MPYAFDTYSGNGSLTDFNISFPYINEDHVKVYVNYTQTSFTFEPNKSTARLASAPASGAVVEVRRITPLANILVDYADGSTLTAGDLDTNNLQHLYIGQELDDIQNKAISLSPTTGLPTAGSRRVTEVADPTAAQDAATKNYVDTTRQPVDAELTELATMSSGTASSLADLTNTEVQILDGATVTTTELNLLDGVTATTAEINYVDGVTSNVQTQLDAKQPLDAELTELATMASDTASSLADLTAAEVQTIDGITSSTSELNILDGVTATAAEINKLDGVTASTAEINYVDGVTSNVQTQLNAKQPLDAELTELATMASTTADALADLTNAEVTILDGATLTTTELNYVDGVTSSVQTQLDAKQPLDSDLTTLAGMQSGTASLLAGSTALTATLTELNQVDGKTIGETTLTANSDTKIPTSKAVNDRILTITNALGGFVAIANETSFPATHPDPSDGAGTVVSISDAGGVVVNGSGVATVSNGAGSGNTVTINGFPSALQSKTLAAGIGLQVQTTTTLHTYDYHKVLAKEADVEQLSDDINDFNNRYRTGSNNPSSDNDAGDLFYNTSTDKMLVRNAANNAWEEVQSIGNFYLQALSGFNGSLNDFTIANPPSNAHQIILSINGVIQKPNAGTSRPSEGFALDGSTLKLSDAPASGATNFYIIMGSAVNIGTPSNNTVTNAILQSGCVDNVKVAANAAIAGSKLADDSIAEVKLDISNTASDGQYLQYKDSTDKLTWSTVTTADATKMPLAGGTFTNDVTFEGNTSGRDILWDKSRDSLVFKDNAYAEWGTGTDLQIYHNGTDNYIKNVSGTLKILMGSEYAIQAVPNGAVELYFDDHKCCETTQDGLKLRGREGASADLIFWADEGDDDQDKWHQYASTGGEMHWKNYTSGSWETSLKLVANGGAYLYNDNSLKLSVEGDVTVGASAHLLPHADNAQDLGSSSKRWRDVYTNDLNLSNEGSSNDVDGSWGSYTIQEGADDLFLINKRNGKKYKFNLTEVS